MAFSLDDTLSGLEVNLPSEAELKKRFDELQATGEDLIQSAPAAPQQEVPQSLGPGQAFMAQLAANLGSSLLQNPQAARQTFLRIQDTINRAREVEDRNFLAQTTRDNTQLRALRAFRIRGLDQQMEQLIDRGSEEDLKQALSLAATKESIIQKIRTEEEKAREAGKQEEKRGTAEFFIERGLTPPGTSLIAGKKGTTKTPKKEVLTAESFASGVRQLSQSIEKIDPELPPDQARSQARGITRQMFDLALVPQAGDTPADVRRRIMTVARTLQGEGDISDLIQHPILGPEIQQALLKVRGE